MKKLLLATTNQAKLKELKSGCKKLEKYGVKILTLDDLLIIKDVEETGETFKENAFIKACFYGKLTNIPTIADDGGLLISILNGEPGVKSKRWLGRDASDNELIKYTLKRLKGLENKKRTAYLQTCICFFNPENKKTIYEEENIKGYITEKPTKNFIKGFPYRALFIVNKFNKYYDELTNKENAQINHRLIALKKLILKVKPYLLK